MNFGFIGVGQAGCNMVNTMRDFPCLVVNTAMQDLEEVNLSNDYKVFTNITSGGAGKDISVGERAILEYKQMLIYKINLIFKNCDYIWVVAGLGGGTGSLGCVQIISILNEMGIFHGVICTLPMEEEGTQEKVNAVLASSQLYKAQNQAYYFRGLIFIDNNELKRLSFMDGNLPYEQLWQQANNKIFGGIKKLIEYSQKSSITSFDPEDYRKILLEKGTILMSDADIEIETNNDIFLISKIQELWQTKLYINGNYKQATGCVVILERPNNYDKDSKAIDILFQQIKEDLQSGFIAKGIYLTKTNLTDTFRSKKIKIFTLLSGMPFPVDKINKLAESAKSEIENIGNKKKIQDIYDTSDLLEFLNLQNNIPQSQMVNLCLFNTDGIDI